MQELKAIHFMTHFDGSYEAFYPKAEADEHIAGLNAEIDKLRQFVADNVHMRWHTCPEELPGDGEIVWAYNKSLKQIVKVLHYGEGRFVPSRISAALLTPTCGCRVRNRRRNDYGPQKI